MTDLSKEDFTILDQGYVYTYLARRLDASLSRSSVTPVAPALSAAGATVMSWHLCVVALRQRTSA